MSVAGVMTMVLLIACLSFIWGYVWKVAGGLGHFLAHRPSPDGLEVDTDTPQTAAGEGTDALVYDLAGRSADAAVETAAESEQSEERAA